jgi:DNA-binding IclR family transcriptional regulator
MKSLSSFAALKADLEATRERGYALDHGEAVLGRSCVAVAITLPTRPEQQAAISLSSSDDAYRARGEQLLSELLDTRQRLQAESAARQHMDASALVGDLTL